MFEISVCAFGISVRCKTLNEQVFFISDFHEKLLGFRRKMCGSVKKYWDLVKNFSGFVLQNSSFGFPVFRLGCVKADFYRKLFGYKSGKQDCNILQTLKSSPNTNICIPLFRKKLSQTAENSEKTCLKKQKTERLLGKRSV